MNTLTFTQLSAIALLVSSSVCYATEQGSWSVTPSIGRLHTDGGRNFNHGPIWKFNIGYQLSDQWALEAEYGDFDTEIEDTDADVDGKFYNLDALLYLTPAQRWQPYVVTGLGKIHIDAEGTPKTEDELFNLGAGLQYALTNNLALRGEVRGLRSLGDDETDTAATVGLSYIIGKTQVAAAEPLPSVDAPDSDGDGIPDSMDQCPNTSAGVQVDATGCEEVIKELRVKLEVHFDVDKAIIKPAYYAEVASLADFMQRHPNTETVIEGHTDSTASESYNQELSERRANAVKSMLVVKYGIAADRLQAVGYGELKPIADNMNAAGRAENRRVIAGVDTIIRTKQ